VETNYRFKFRRVMPGTDPVLLEREPGFDLDAGVFKIGDGYSRWSQLKTYMPQRSGSQEDIPAALVDHIESELPHPVYDDGPSLSLIYQNAKV